MKQRQKIVSIAIWLLAGTAIAQVNSRKMYIEKTDRDYWISTICRIAEPVLMHMSRGELARSMQIEYAPAWDGRDRRVAYLECFGRTMYGISPWLALTGDEGTSEGAIRKQLRVWALKSYAHAVNPESPDYMLWQGSQPLVDAAFLAGSFLRAPKQLWEPLDTLTKHRYIQAFKELRSTEPPYNNWLLFSATIETFLLSVQAGGDKFRISTALRKMEEWYVGDGWYADGNNFAFDYYNSFVIQPMYVDLLQALVDGNLSAAGKNTAGLQAQLNIATRRMQRMGILLERMVSPEGAFPLFGRSMTYRLAVFQPLALLALKQQLPEGLAPGQVRSALTSAMKRLFSAPGNFNEAGFLQLGFAGHQPELADYYTNSGSLYLTTEVFLPLGLPADHPFWTSPSEEWTQKRAWSGKPVPKDHAIGY